MLSQLVLGHGGQGTDTMRRPALGQCHKGVYDQTEVQRQRYTIDIIPISSGQSYGYPPSFWEAEKYNATYNRARDCQTTHGRMDFFGQDPRTTHTQTLYVSHLTQKYHRHLPHPMAIDVSICRFRPTELPLNFFLFFLSYRFFAHKEESTLHALSKQITTVPALVTIQQLLRIFLEVLISGSQSNEFLQHVTTGPIAQLVRA